MEILELNTTKIKKKITDRLNSRSEKGSELEGRTIQLIQSKKTKGKKIKET